ncbi:MAG: sugar phosphate isomerase/epimerase family protein [Bryobacterales bacterium]|nr:sugar phosphate isomerase/epimerase [Bryobacteraceae bacterium]MDW8130817.1 sugar phosphate isomerase/epimerase family protein [Bryobacterales bacterium]
MSINRREWFLSGLAALQAARTSQSRPVLCAFSKHFQWTSGIPEMAEILLTLGYEGVDLTVRPGGHVEPERVEEDLPRTVEMIRKAGLKLPMVTTRIVDARSPGVEPILKTCRALGIPLYRCDNFTYDFNRPLPTQLEDFRARLRELAALNRQYGVCAIYHTHSGPGRVGASMWDLYLLLKDFDTQALAINYDIGHATVEGGYGGWIHSARLLLPMTRGVAVKDFLWRKNDKGAWVPGWRPLGEGMVNFREFFAMLRQSGFAGPIQLHMEYPELGGAARGDRSVDIPRPKLLELMRRDVETLKGWLHEAGLS